MVRTRPQLLIRDAEIWGEGRGDVLIADGLVQHIGIELPGADAERTIVARGGALLPGLHDHHIHLAGLAVRSASIWCGPPGVADADTLRARLAKAPGDGWIRAIGYHESVLAALPDARALDTFVRDRPLRMQHRSGRMWLLNTAALEILLDQGEPPPGLEREGGSFTGRLFDEDAWLRRALGSVPPDFSAISAELAGYGVTGITDMTPQNGPDMARHFDAQRRAGCLGQECMLAGTLALFDAAPGDWIPGPVKLHLHEADLPEFDAAVALISAAHEQGRVVAVHCVTEVELVYTLALLDEAGCAPGDRIEHASITPADLAKRMAAMGLAVCVQPHFVAERGDRYLQDVEPRHHADLYRLSSLAQAGISLAGGSDAPFASADPWAAMRAAESRKTQGGASIGPAEALSPEQALSLYLADPADLSRQRRIVSGAKANLCLLKVGWQDARESLCSDDVAATIVSGRIIHDRVDQPPVEGMAR